MVTKVLIVEDDADTQRNLRDILHTCGYETETVCTAVDAIRRINQSIYDVIIIDWYLPDTTADELLPRLQQLAPDASVLIATGSSDLQHAIYAMRHGASDYIVKPICPDLLLGSLRRSMKLLQAQRRAADAERLAAIGTAVAAVAHESRGALQRIRSRVDLIRMMHKDDAGLLQDLDSIDNASALLQLLFEELRQFSAPVVIKKSLCGLRELVQQAWRSVKCCGAHPDAEMNFPDDDIQCCINGVRMEQVMRNLFDNAVAAGGDSARVEVDWKIEVVDDEPVVVIAVRDNGPGFTPDQRASAFEPFFTTKGHGTGLGLSICRRIVEAHGGTIEIEDGDGCGAVIAVRLPGQLCDAGEVLSPRIEAMVCT